MSKILELEMATSEKTKEKRQWPLKLWECYSYRDLKVDEIFGNPVSIDGFYRGINVGAQRSVVRH